ncbi:MAG: hypothetical protein J3K34DRAFT_415889 [Monoraphidium minutum]|nr:MAG: hypothetical protein J3K34DRAFT_415889 [Monoraphidium minutum]
MACVWSRIRVQGAGAAHGCIRRAWRRGGPAAPSAAPGPSRRNVRCMQGSWLACTAGARGFLPCVLRAWRRVFVLRGAWVRAERGRRMITQCSKHAPLGNVACARPNLAKVPARRKYRARARARRRRSDNCSRGRNGVLLCIVHGGALRDAGRSWLRAGPQKRPTQACTRGRVRFSI